MLRARETVHIVTKGGVRTVTPEDRIEDGDDLVKGRESLFEKVDDGGGETKPARTRRQQSKASGSSPAKSRSTDS